MKDTPIKNLMLLFITAVIWGVAFVAQQMGMDYLQPLGFSAVRFFLGGLALLPVLFVRSRKRNTEEKAEMNQKVTWIGGLVCGVLLCIASNLQQFGIQFTTVGKAGFITALYIVIVPIIGLFLHKKVGVKLWISVVIAAVGLYFLCMTGSFSLEFGDTIIFLCAIMFSLHIVVVDAIGLKIDGVKLSCIQFFVVSILSAVAMLIWEAPPAWEMIYAARVPLLYTGILSSGVAYTFQILGQKNVDPSIASLILSLEAVISVIAAWLILQQSMSPREILGALLMFIAIILAQLPERAKKPKFSKVKAPSKS